MFLPSRQQMRDTPKWLVHDQDLIRVGSSESEMDEYG